MLNLTALNLLAVKFIGSQSIKKNVENLVFSYEATVSFHSSPTSVKALYKQSTISFHTVLANKEVFSL